MHDALEMTGMFGLVALVLDTHDEHRGIGSRRCAHCSLCNYPDSPATSDKGFGGGLGGGGLDVRRDGAAGIAPGGHEACVDSAVSAFGLAVGASRDVYGFEDLFGNHARS